MALYNVVGECVVDGKHFPRPHPEPVEVDDAAARPLVEDGKLVAVELPHSDPEPPRRGRTPVVEE
jgi:hypothetical protein